MRNYLHEAIVDNFLYCMLFDIGPVSSSQFWKYLNPWECSHVSQATLSDCASALRIFGFQTFLPPFLMSALFFSTSGEAHLSNANIVRCVIFHPSHIKTLTWTSWRACMFYCFWRSLIFVVYLVWIFCYRRGTVRTLLVANSLLFWWLFLLS